MKSGHLFSVESNWNLKASCGMMAERHCRIYLIVFLSVCVSFSACVRTPSATNDATVVSDYLSQFVALSPTSADLVWIVTSQGDLISISSEGQQRPAGIGQVALVTFVDPAHGWVLHRNGRISSTADGGRSWKLVFAPAGSDSFYQPQQLIFSDELHGWVIGLFAIWKTVDGGKTWSEKFSVAKTEEERIGRLYRGVFVNNDLGWVSSSGGAVLQTTNGGENWKPILLDTERTDVHDIFFTDEQRGWLIGRPNGGIYFTSDGGITWRPQFERDGLHLNSASFIDNTQGWVSGWHLKNEPSGREGVVMRTTDGLHWENLDNAPGESVFTAIRFSDKQHGWLAGKDTLYRSEDGGNSWQVILKLPPIVNK